MSDLDTIQNALDLLSALRRRRLWRVEVGPCDLGDHAGEDFADVQFGHVRMVGTKMVGTRLPRLHADRWVGRGMLLRGSRFEGARLHQCEFSASQAQAVQWQGALLEGCRVVETPMTNANLSRAVIRGSMFSNSDLNHCNLTEALIVGSRFTDQRQGGAVLDNANLAGAVLVNVDLRGANLLRANFDGAVLVHVDLRDANLVDIKLDGAVCIGVQVDRADGSDATLRALRDGHADLDVIAKALEKHHDPRQLSLIAAAGLLAAASVSPEPVSAGASAGGDGGVDALLRLDFPTLLGELQGRGGPAELGRLRIEGQHVYARGVDGEEVRLTDGTRSEPVRPPVMRTPEPSAPARGGPMPASPASPVASASRAAPAAPRPARGVPEPGGGEGLEID